MIYQLAVAVALAIQGIVPAPSAAGSWLQWGGPQRDFSCPDPGELATQWADSGPKVLWKRDLGDGYSAILAEGDRLYTMCRRGEQDAVVAVDAGTGKTVWETTYDAPPKPGMQLDFGQGPNSTPLLQGDRLFTVGATVLFHCLDKHTGRVLWKHDLMEELGASHVGRGFSASPLAYGDLVILPVGGKEASVVAFKQDTGDVVWKTPGFRPGHSSPILGTVQGQEQIVLALGTDRAGLDPATGALKWKLTLDQQAAAQMGTPLQIDDGLFFYSAAYGSGSRLIKVASKDDGLVGEELWHTRKLKVQHGSYLQYGDLVVGSSGDFGPTFLMALKWEDGKVAWRKRGFAKATLIKVGDKMLILDETGVLALATPTADRLEIHAQAKLLEEQAWTVPTLVGTTVYLRDRKTMLAVDLGPASAGSEQAGDKQATKSQEQAG
ncbi:MAG: PQQ-binding-like beta-propeller repeat protein [bacterium]|nr:PQQ-binding-like beta-propeller repeat protein [bacterium]